MSLVYMGLLILAVAFLYRLFLLYAEAWKHSVVAEADARVKAETDSFANAGLNATVNTNARVNAKTAAQSSADYFDEAAATENKKDTTATENVTAVSADLFDNNQLETFADETETFELFTTEIAANLYITLPTAKYHISNILQKTGAQNQRELRYMIKKDEP